VERKQYEVLMIVQQLELDQLELFHQLLKE
jgi:hypothetical protein